MVKNPPAYAGGKDLILGLGRSPERNGNPLQYSCPAIPMTEEPGMLPSMQVQQS